MNILNPVYHSLCPHLVASWVGVGAWRPPHPQQPCTATKSHLSLQEIIVHHSCTGSLQEAFSVVEAASWTNFTPMWGAGVAGIATHCPEPGAFALPSPTPKSTTGWHTRAIKAKGEFFLLFCNLFPFGR